MGEEWPMGSVPTDVAGARDPGRYRFGGILVDTVAHTLSKDGQAKALEPKAFSVLVQLLAHPGELVSRDQLMDAVWGHRHVTPGVLTRAVAQLRTAMDDDPRRPRYIQTHHALGYRFIGELEDEREAAEDHAPPGEPAAIARDEAPATSLERRRADRIAHRRWLLVAMLLAAALAFVVGAVVLQPVAGPP